MMFRSFFNETVKIITANKSFTNIFSKSGGVGVSALYADNAMILPPGFRNRLRK